MTTLLALRDKDLDMKAKEVERAVSKASELNILVTDLYAANTSITQENTELRAEIKRKQDIILELGTVGMSLRAHFS